LPEPLLQPAGPWPADPHPPPTTSNFASMAELGWDDGYEGCLQDLMSIDPVRYSSAVAGRVLRRDKTACQVAFGGREAHCPILPSLLGDPLGEPTTGDFVAVRGPEIVALLERRTSVMRGSFRNLTAQVLAANVDHVLLAVSLGAKFRPGRLERLLVVAWQTGAVPIVVLTKLDCCDDPEDAYKHTRALAPGASIHMVSAVTGQGTDDLAAALAPRTTSVILGPSGAGKSTLANVLCDSSAEQLATQEVRGDGKGRHTTVTRELVKLANGALMIDTPGLRAIGLWDAEDALNEAFSDVDDLAKQCRFTDCAHDTEPGCVVAAAVASGDLSVERLTSYQKLQREQRRLAARNDSKLRAERRAEFKAFNKQHRRTPHR
jgi:ribosome biogenesis GTPase